MRQICKCLTYKFVSKLSIQYVLAMFALCLDKITRIKPFSAFDESSYNIGAKALSITYYGIKSLFAHIVYEIDTKVNALQLFKQ